MLTFALSLAAHATPPLASADAAAGRDDDAVDAIAPLAPDDPTGAPVVFGTREEGYPSTVALGLAGQIFCSGSVIAPRVVLTAAHCVSGEIPTDAVVNYASIYFGAEAADPDDRIAITGAIPHPGWVPLSGLDLGENDLAVVFLEDDAPVDPVWPRVEPLKPRRDTGTDVVSVGFGLDEIGRSGVKKSATLHIDEIDDVFLVSYSAGNTDNANVCSGDSGGPQYHVEEDGTLSQWSVHTFADANCRFESGSTRVDTQIDWILEQVADEQGTSDRCEIFGQYGDGTCDWDCDKTDPDCLPTFFAPTPTGCDTGHGASLAGVALALAALRRRRQGVPAKATTIENRRRSPSST
ncbi:MAG: trypsin-like serine protease [Myxococcota bacterium]